MKKLKLILSLMIAVMILCLSISTAFAVDTQDDAYMYEKVGELHDLCMMSVNVYGASAKDDNYSHKPGVVYLSISNLHEINEALNEATDIIYKYGYPMVFENYNGVTQEEIQLAYDNLEKAMNKATVDKSEIEVLIGFCLREKNDNYYPNEVWAEFENSISYAKEVLRDEDAKGEDCNRAYFLMMYNYNKLCVVNQQYGDVDFDGKVTVADVTKLQRIIAKLDDANSSILQICKTDVTYATEIQRYMASLSDNIDVFPARFEYMNDNIECSNYDSQLWYFNSWRMNYLFMDYISRC